MVQEQRILELLWYGMNQEIMKMSFCVVQTLD